MTKKRHTGTGKDQNVQLRYENLSPSDQDMISAGLRRGASRREVMSWLIASGVTIACAGTIVSSARKAVAATPKKGGKVVFAGNQHGPQDTLDPGLQNGDVDYGRSRATYNCLVQINDDLSTRPELAEEYSANGNNTEWTFKLRKGVKFHDGSPFSADDVIYSMNRHYGDDSTSVAKPLVADVAEWKKVDSHTVKAVMSQANADLPSVLGTFHFKMIKDGTTEFQKPVGTGPFKVREFSPGVRSLHDRNDDYWREGANIEELVITAITDDVARTSALLAGDIDMMGLLSPKAVKKVEATPGVGIWSVPSGAYLGICCMKNSAPGNNPDFVRAMQFIQRRKKMVKSVLKGQGTIGNDQPINPAYGADHCGELPIREHDLDKAKFHLKKSGITEAELQVAEIKPGMTDISLLTQREASKIGLDLKIKKVPNDGYWGAVWMKTPLNVTSWNMRPTAAAMINIAFAPGAPWNDSAWHDERIGKWLKDASAETDAAKRHEIFCAIQTLINQESGMVIMTHRNNLDAKSDLIQGVGRNPLAAFSGSEWPEFVWRADA